MPYKSTVVSYPRSGSNFLQNVVNNSVSIACSSLYGLGQAQKPSKFGLLKSHALNYDWLVDEYDRFNIEHGSNYKLIWLVRDPRDVFVSFHNFVESRNKVKIDPSSFLDGVSFEYALEYGTARSFDRKVELSPRSVWEYYLDHVRFWNEHHNLGKSQAFRYEDLLDPGSVQWADLFELLCNRRIHPERNTMEEKVSTYDSRKRPRGITKSWDYEGSPYLDFCGEVFERCKKSLPKFIEEFNYDTH